MSHFTVAVFTEPNGKTVEELLAPYDENIEMERYVEYTKAQMIEKGKKEIEEYSTTGNYAEYLKDPDKYAAGCKNEDHLNYLKNEFPKRLQWTDEEIYQDQIKFYEKDQIGPDGEVYSTYNPKSKWDWWSEGGRWGGMLLINSTESEDYPSAWNCSGRKAIAGYAWVDSAKVSDIQWDKIRENDRVERIKYWDEAEGKDEFLRYIEYGIGKEMTREEYINKESAFSTFAVIMPDGQWYEKGKMGYWACVSNEEEVWGEKYKERFLDKADPEWTLTIIDCHI